MRSTTPFVATPHTVEPPSPRCGITSAPSFYPASDYNNTGQTVFTIGVVYDWCYPLLTPDDRATLIGAAIETAGRMEIGWPPVEQGNVTGHGPEGQIFRDLLCASIAMYDEKPEMYELTAGRFFSRMVGPKKFMYPAGMHAQGSHYTNYRGQWEMLATWIFARMGLPEVFGPEQKNFMYWSLYARRGDGQILRDGDTHINNRPPGEYYTGHSRSFFLAANYFGDPYLKMEAVRERPSLEPSEPRGNQSLDCVELLIFNDPELEPRPLGELPLTRYFPSPRGAMIARTGWEDGVHSPAVVAEMKVNEWYFGNHQHLDAGAFQIYYRGALATDSGYYQAGDKSAGSTTNNGNTAYGSVYDVNYNKRTVAHNCVTVYGPRRAIRVQAIREAACRKRRRPADAQPLDRAARTRRPAQPLQRLPHRRSAGPRRRSPERCAGLLVPQGRPRARLLGQD